MPRTCKIHIQISTGAIVDAETLGFYLMDSDDTVTPPMREYEVQVYPESAVAEIYPYTVKEPFDYSVTMLAFGPENSVNSSVQAFYDSLFTITPGTDVRKALPVTLYNEWKGMKVTGYVKAAQPKDAYPKLTEAEKSAYLFSLVLYVADPRTLLPWNNE